jgi:hypothetical protein
MKHNTRGSKSKHRLGEDFIMSPPTKLINTPGTCGNSPTPSKQNSFLARLTRVEEIVELVEKLSLDAAHEKHLRQSLEVELTNTRTSVDALCRDLRNLQTELSDSRNTISSQDREIKLLKSHTSALSSQYSKQQADLAKHHSELTEKTKQLEADLLSLTLENKNITSKLVDLESSNTKQLDGPRILTASTPCPGESPPSAEITASLTNAIRTEQRDRENRSKNVIIYGLPQGPSESDDDDTLNILDAEVLQKIAVSIIPESTRRLGKPLEGKHRPILVKLMSLSDRKLLLAKKNALKTLNLSIQEDLTLAQRQVLPMEWAKVKQAWADGKWAAIRGGVAVIRNLRDGEEAIKLNK